MLLHDEPLGQQILDLSPFHDLARDARKIVLALRTVTWAMEDDFIWRLDQCQVVPSVAWLPAILLPTGFSLAGGLSGWAITRRRFTAIVAVLLQPPFQVVQTAKKLGDLPA
jgi:hypothetical protein